MTSTRFNRIKALLALTLALGAVTLSATEDNVAVMSGEFSTDEGIVYQPQISEDLETWTNYGPAFVGNGDSICLYVPRTLITDEFLHVRLLQNGVTELPTAESVYLGDGASAYGRASVAIGAHATAMPHDEIAPGNGTETVAIGSNSMARGWRTTALGHGAHAEGVSSTAIGRWAVARGAHMVAIGRGAFVDSRYSEFPAASIAVDHLYIGGPAGVHKFIDPSGDIYWDANGEKTSVREDVPTPVAIHGRDAYDARHDQDPETYPIESLDQNVAGGDLELVAGVGTGSADSGSVVVRTAPGGESGHKKNESMPVAVFDADTETEGATPFLLYNNDTGTLQRVRLGAPDSGGDGLRALVVDN